MLPPKTSAWPASRGFRPTAVIAAAFVTAAGFWWFLARGHRWAEMLGSLVLVEALLVGLIFIYSGSAALDAFFLDWFLGVNVIASRLEHPPGTA